MSSQTNETEFINLLSSNQNLVHKICRMYTNDKAAHDDLFQEISIQLWRSFDRFEGKSKFSTWMYRVGLNTAITLYRKEKKRIDRSVLNENMPQIVLKEYNGEVDQQLAWLYRKINSFSEVDKALTLLYLEDKKYDEIAETLGISSVNARVKMNRIKKRLKDMINDRQDG
ncbi:MAG: sigma-70 family RNA polymerase sigma factor [Flavobacteriaceae bacterium]|nr:sigma-70 family RNA polymerase sigma factor [Flavobacteriaceae bacterium]